MKKVLFLVMMSVLSFANSAFAAASEGGQGEGGKEAGAAFLGLSVDLYIILFSLIIMGFFIAVMVRDFAKNS
jgi:hypothetical protein